MSHELRSLVFLAAPAECIDPLRIKVSSTLGAVVAFASSEVATEFARRWNVEPKVLGAEQLPPGAIGGSSLLVFESMDEVDAAQNQAAYDFSRHLQPWPT